MARKDNDDRVTTKVAGYYVESTITLGKDKDGKKYDSENNPRRGASQARFGVYKDGMTIGQALKNGVQRSDIRSDLKKGFISIKAVPMPEVEKPVTEKKEKGKGKADAKVDAKADTKSAPVDGGTKPAADGSPKTA